MSANNEIIIRPLLLRDISGGMRLSNQQRWNQTRKDWELLTGSPLNICLLAECDKNIVGTITAMNYDNAVAWIGMVLVDKGYRGRGISKLLLRGMFEKLQGFKSVKLDATAEGQPVYQKIGFLEEYSIARMTNVSVKNMRVYNDNVLPEEVQKSDLAAIIQMDKHVFGADRSGLIKWLVNEYPHKAFVLKRNGVVAGFVLGRDGINYNQVGQLAALTTADAQTLIAKAFSVLENKPVVVDVPCDKTSIISWLQSAGFMQQRSFVRMYQNENVFAGLPENQFLICGPEFG